MSSTVRRLSPPLNALRAFEAAARHLSLSLAANELNVTPAAISRRARPLCRGDHPVAASPIARRHSGSARLRCRRAC
jgi:hypothetical protein